MAFTNSKLINITSESSDFVGKPYLLADNSLRTIDWSKSFKLLDTYSIQSKTTPSLEILKDDTSVNQKLFLFKNLLSKKDCNTIIAKCEQQELQEMESHYKSGRTNSRLVVFDPNFSSFLWEKVKEVLEGIYTQQEVELRPLGFDVLRGSWEFSGINQAIRFNKYDSERKEFFEPHRDSQFCPSGDERSLLSVVIYLNERFRGGETKFYFPKDTSICCKGLTMKEEFEMHGGLGNGYDVVTVKPKCGNAIIFNQNIIHESSPMIGRNDKFIIKTDVMLRRRNEKCGFTVSAEEKDDYLSCLNTFREAQQAELGAIGTAAGLYEKCLSIRYHYPTNEMISMKDKYNSIDMLDSQESSQGYGQSYSSMSESVVTPFLLFPPEILQYIMTYVTGEADLLSLALAYPTLLPLKKGFDAEKMIPDIDYNEGIFSKFTFNNAEFAEVYIEECCRIAALYSVYLLGHNKDAKTYTVQYSQEKGEVVAIGLRQLLKDVFYEEESYGAIFKVLQQGEKPNARDDFIGSVDRRFIAEKYNSEFLGIDIEQEFQCKLKVTSELDFQFDGESFSEYDPGDMWDEIKEYNIDNIGNPDYLNCYDRLFEVVRSSGNRLYHGLCNVYCCEEEDEDDPGQGFRRFTNLFDSLYSNDKVRNEKSMSNNHVGAAIVRTLIKPAQFEFGVGLCACHFLGGPVGDYAMNEHIQTLTFNHLIADFSKHEFFSYRGYNIAG